MSDWTHTIHGSGNGFPAVGDKVYDGDGDVLEVIEMSCIHTIQWESNYVYAVLEATGESWDDEQGEEESLASQDYEVRTLSSDADDE